MLSYMVPSIEDKPPPAPKRLQLELEDHDRLGLTNGHALVNGTDMLVTTSSLPTDPVVVKTEKVVRTVTVNGTKGVAKSNTLSTESSASSLSSSGVADVVPTHIHDKPKPKLISNGGTKHQSLKRVSFGSSKGSMVETLIYESPVQEEPEVSPTPDPADPDSTSQSESKHPSKVRVTFFEQEKPLVVSSPEPEITEELDAPFVLSMTSPSPVVDHVAPYHRQTSTDSGWDNPFRPDGDLSREADEIVELIKGGKPITPTPGSTAPPLPAVESDVSAQTASPASSPARGANGTAPATATAPSPAPVTNKPGAVELQRATVAPSDASQVEHVVLKKKPKCKCCVIQ
ncbi:flocculation protein FLO11 [Homalodisca vitripennis]|uniref:flocculation protein FLO11 n=1 Tax=Homalodisca vitripennis TaxID=197043 RepID=UPI001EEA4961|nr:flocculation protein FLO11 [Homalodisca vitripennis]XP_046666387.1 flocculation protein FLO11 [Homalodisca vitripennis]